MSGCSRARTGKNVRAATPSIAHAHLAHPAKFEFFASHMSLHEHYSWLASLHAYELARSVSVQPNDAQQAVNSTSERDSYFNAFASAAAQSVLTSAQSVLTPKRDLNAFASAETTETGCSIALMFVVLVVVTHGLSRALVQLGGIKKMKDGTADTRAGLTTPSAVRQARLHGERCFENEPNLALSPPPTLERHRTDLPEQVEPTPPPMMEDVVAATPIRLARTLEEQRSDQRVLSVRSELGAMIEPEPSVPVPSHAKLGRSHAAELRARRAAIQKEAKEAADRAQGPQMVEEPAPLVPPAPVIEEPLAAYQQQPAKADANDKENGSLANGQEVSQSGIQGEQGVIQGMPDTMIVSSRKVLRAVDLAYSNSDIKEALIAKLRDRAAKVRASVSSIQVHDECEASVRAHNVTSNIARFRGIGAVQVLPNGAGSVAQVLAAARRLDLPLLTSPQPPSPD